MSRRFASRRRISLSDTDAGGRLRLDAVARYLQDAASEDWLDAGFDHDSHVWVVRRTELEVHEPFHPEDSFTIETWCSGVAASAASRRYSLRGDRAGGHLEADVTFAYSSDIRVKVAAPKKRFRRLRPTFDASLITGIDPPHEVESALAAINTAHNQVSSDISLAQASADQKIVQSRRAVEIETLKAQAEVEPLRAMAAQLSDLKRHGPEALAIYLRNVRLKLFSQAQRIILEVKE